MPLWKKENLNLNKYPPNVHGLTGSIACGKTTVANLFKKNGIFVLDLDDVAKEVVKKGWNWSDYPLPVPQADKVIPASKLPQDI